MTADEMFKELGYVVEETKSNIFIGEGLEHFSSLFVIHKKSKSITFYKMLVSQQELEAINKKVEELRMGIEEFLKLAQQAEEDEYGNLYIKEGCFTKKDDLFYEDMKDKKWYFTLTNTVCDDFIKKYCSQDSKNNFEHYNRHFINDDTIEIKVINNGSPKRCEEY